jgi:hypothetical protein
MAEAHARFKRSNVVHVNGNLKNGTPQLELCVAKRALYTQWLCCASRTVSMAAPASVVHDTAIAPPDDSWGKSSSFSWLRTAAYRSAFSQFIVVGWGDGVHA